MFCQTNADFRLHSIPPAYQIGNYKLQPAIMGIRIVWIGVSIAVSVKLATPSEKCKAKIDWKIGDLKQLKHLPSSVNLRKPKSSQGESSPRIGTVIMPMT